MLRWCRSIGASMEVATLEAFALNTKRVTRSRTSDQRDGDRDTEMESGKKKTYRQFFFI